MKKFAAGDFMIYVVMWYCFLVNVIGIRGVDIIQDGLVAWSLVLEYLVGGVIGEVVIGYICMWDGGFNSVGLGSVEVSIFDPLLYVRGMDVGVLKDV
ncbi:hypothetical protein DAPPUDRAFT_242119 [Daphnia pulex]|uniref:Transmembrane protein n=1 Tax=Daphnia pulex TaxID=6669 RepID=E9GFX5_DAPPU|nr:hypothetical protein DAPPUDRAFT_242119 [Daphnia pulex]|eukprot:EFX81735.1 hypothetical protein DAPPUDRAFT_242119 [Daphnia pulex]